MCVATLACPGKNKGGSSLHLWHPVLTADLPWGPSSCRWLALLPSAPPTGLPEPNAVSNVSPTLGSTAQTISPGAQPTFSHIIHLIQHQLRTRKCLGWRSQIFMSYFEILSLVLWRFQKLLKEPDLFVCDISTVWLDWRPEPEGYFRDEDKSQWRFTGRLNNLALILMRHHLITEKLMQLNLIISYI